MPSTSYINFLLDNILPSEKKHSQYNFYKQPVYMQLALEC